MPKFTREKTKYPGVTFITGTTVGNSKPERIYYIRYRKNGRLIEEKVGRQFQDDMTPARANQIRIERIQGDQLSNKGRREAVREQEQAEANKWTLDKLWEFYKEHRPEVKGIAIDEIRYKNCIKPIFGDKETKDLCSFDVDKLRVRLLKTKKPGTVKKVLELLRRIVNYGARKSLCEEVSFTIEMPKVNDLKTEDLTPEQFSRLIEAMEKDSNIQAKNLMRMALFTGMRRGELFRLKWKDVDFDRQFICIRDPKCGRDQTIPLNDTCKELLKSHPKTESEYVFPGRGGQQRMDIRKQVNRIKDRAGLPKEFRALHGLRHVYASMLASSGQVDMYTLQKLLTHKSPIMTQRYAHLRDEALRKASDLAGDIINQASGKNRSSS